MRRRVVLGMLAAILLVPFGVATAAAQPATAPSQPVDRKILRRQKRAVKRLKKTRKKIIKRQRHEAKQLFKRSEDETLRVHR